MAVGRSPLIVLFTSAVVALSVVNAHESTILALTKSKLPGTITCPGDFDLVVILDHSLSLSSEKSAGFIEFIKKLVHLFNIREDGNHFGLVLYNENPEIIMKLDRNNTVEEIKDYLLTSLPGREKWQNLQRALRETRRQILTAAMGNRPDAKNVCILLTTEGGASVRSNKQYPKIKEDCDYFILLRKGDYNDLEKVQDAICPTITTEEAKNKTIELCSPFCNNLTEPCNEKKEGLCPLPYVPVDDCCFYITYSRAPWDGGLAECQRVNGSLVKIDSEEKTKKFLQYTDSLEISSEYRIIWIGLRDETGDNDDHHWISDGAQLTYSNWVYGEPNDAMENCTGLFPNFFNGQDPGKWTDQFCTQRFAAACETQQLEH